MMNPPSTALPDHPNRVTESSAFHRDLVFLGTKSIKMPFLRGLQQCWAVLTKYNAKTMYQWSLSKQVVGWHWFTNVPFKPGTLAKVQTLCSTVPLG